MALGAARVGAVEGLVDVLGVGHDGGRIIAHAQHGLLARARCERDLAGRVRVRLGRQRRPRAQAGDHHAEPEREDQRRPVEQRLLVAEAGAEDEREQVGDAEVGRARRAVDGPVGDEPAADREDDELPAVGQGARLQAPERAERADQGRHDPRQRDREDRQPGGVDHLLRVPGRLTSQEQRGDGVARRGDEQHPAVGGDRARVQHPVDERQPGGPEREPGDQRADRRPPRDRRIQRGAGQRQRRPYDRAGRERVEVGAQHVGERQQRWVHQQQPAHQQHGLECVGPPLLAHLHAERVDRAARQPRIARCTPVGSLSASRISSSATPTVTSTAPAAISGPRCGGGRRSSSSAWHQIPGFGTGPSPE